MVNPNGSTSFKVGTASCLYFSDEEAFTLLWKNKAKSLNIHAAYSNEPIKMQSKYMQPYRGKTSFAKHCNL